MLVGTFIPLIYIAVPFNMPLIARTRLFGKPSLTSSFMRIYLSTLSNDFTRSTANVQWVGLFLLPLCDFISSFAFCSHSWISAMLFKQEQPFLKPLCCGESILLSSVNQSILFNNICSYNFSNDDDTAIVLTFPTEGNLLPGSLLIGNILNVRRYSGIFPPFNQFSNIGFSFIINLSLKASFFKILSCSPSSPVAFPYLSLSNAICMSSSVILNLLSSS